MRNPPTTRLADLPTEGATAAILYLRTPERPAFHVEMTADLPALGLMAGDRVTLTPQDRIDCDCRYLLQDATFAQVQYWRNNTVRIVWESGAVEIMPRSEINPRIAARVRTVTRERSDT